MKKKQKEKFLKKKIESRKENWDINEKLTKIDGNKNVKEDRNSGNDKLIKKKKNGELRVPTSQIITRQAFVLCGDDGRQKANKPIFYVYCYN